MNKLRKRYNETMVQLVGNRVTLASYLGMVAGAALIADGLSNSGYMASGFNVGAAELSGGILLALLGPIPAAATYLGRGTLELYRRTRDYIERKGHLDERFVERTIKCIQSKAGYRGSKTNGYCEEQGMYLAAKEAGRDSLEVFRRTHGKHSRIRIPHF